MTLQQLRYIVALDDERHFARAADACMVTQPGLTIQLKNLEEEIGIRIFDRSKVPLIPTQAGVEIILRARRILSESAALRDYVITEKNHLEGTVTLGVIPTLAPYLIPPFLKAVRQHTPKMQYVVREMGTGELLQSLRAGKIDIALMATPTGIADFREHRVFEEPFLAYLNPSHSMAGAPSYTLRPADKAELLLLETEFCYNAQLLDICGLASPGQKKPSYSFEARSIETLKHLVRADMGFAIVPQLSVGDDESPYFKPFEGTQPAREISLVTSDTFARKKLLEAISETLWACLPDAIRTQSAYRKIRWNDSPYFHESVKAAQARS